jgi:hypothetical protein
MKTKLIEIGAEAVPTTQREPEFLSEFLRNEIGKYKSALGTAGILPQ